MDRPGEDDIRNKVRAVYEKAIDAALDADPDDIHAIDVGLRAARYLVDGRMVEPPNFSEYDDDPTIGEEISTDVLRVDRIALEVGPDLARRADPDDIDGDLLERLRHVRRRIAVEYGVIAPGIRVRPHPNLGPGSYRLRIRGNLVAEGTVSLAQVMGTGLDLEVPGIEVERTVDPLFGRPAVWLSAGDADRATQHGLTVFDAEDVLASHVADVIRRHLADLMDREEVAELLNVARRETPMVVQELVPNMLALGQLRQVLQHLVREQVPIKDLGTILNALADHAVYTKDPHALAEHVRASLGRTICTRLQTDDGSLAVFQLSPDAERAIQNAIQLNETGQVLMLDPNTSQAIHAQFRHAVDQHPHLLEPVVLTPPKIRRHVKALLDRAFPQVVVLSHAEVVAGVQIDNLQTIEASSAAVNPPVAASGGDWLLGDEDA